MEFSEKDLEHILRFGKSANTIGEYQSKDFIYLPYGLVKVDLPNEIKSNHWENAINLILSSQYEKVEISHATGNEVMSFILWIKEQLEMIFNLEMKHLHTEPKAELLASGINRLDEFGALATIDNLAGGDILKHEKIKALPYFEVYQKLKLDKIQNEIKERYENILKSKVKR